MKPVPEFIPKTIWFIKVLWLITDDDWNDDTDLWGDKTKLELLAYGLEMCLEKEE